MGMLFGLVTGALAALVTYSFSGAAFANAGSLGKPSALALVVFAGVTAFLAGSSAYRRARRTHDRLGLFSATAFAFSCALVGMAFMVSLVGLYLHTYQVASSGASDTVMTALAYPVFGALGLVLGGISGWLFGLIASGALRLLVPATR